MPEFQRREFLKLVGASAGAAATVGCEPVNKLIPYVIQPEVIVPGIADYYASTCQECSAGCGLLVKTREGRPIKLEGNPANPINKGALCARGQASIGRTYHPDRYRGPAEARRRQAGPHHLGRRARHPRRRSSSARATAPGCSAARPVRPRAPGSTSGSRPSAPAAASSTNRSRPKRCAKRRSRCSASRASRSSTSRTRTSSSTSAPTSSSRARRRPSTRASSPRRATSPSPSAAPRASSTSARASR